MCYVTYVHSTVVDKSSQTIHVKSPVNRKFEAPIERKASLYNTIMLSYNLYQDDDIILKPNKPFKRSKTDGAFSDAKKEVPDMEIDQLCAAFAKMSLGEPPFQTTSGFDTPKVKKVSAIDMDQLCAAFAKMSCECDCIDMEVDMEECDCIDMEVDQFCAVFAKMSLESSCETEEDTKVDMEIDQFCAVFAKMSLV